MAIANAATNTQQVAIEVARDHVRELRASSACAASPQPVIGDEVVIVAVEGPAAPLGVTAEVGYRASLAPPSGLPVPRVVRSGDD